MSPPAEGKATKPKNRGATGKQTQRSGSRPTPRTSTPSPTRTSRHTKMKDRKRAKKIAGRFIAIISSIETTSGGEDDISPPGTEDKSEDTETARPLGEAEGSGSDSDSEVTVQIRKTAQKKQKERRRRLEQGHREAHPFPPYAGPRISYWEPRWKEAEDDERSPPRVRPKPHDRQ